MTTAAVRPVQKGAPGPTHRKTLKKARVDIRTTEEMRNLIEQAASLRGLSVAEYAKAVLAEHARGVVEEHETRRLTDRDRDRFLDLLDNPPAPNDALRAAAASFRQAVATGSLIP